MFTRRFLQTTAAIIGLVPVLAVAECYQEAVTTNNARAEIKEVADFQKFVKSNKLPVMEEQAIKSI